MNFVGKKISVLGAARSGIACANLLSSLGAKIFLSEIKKKEEIENLSELNENVETEFGRHSEKLLSCDFLILSPGIPLDIPIIKKAKEKDIPLYSELEIAYRLIQPKLLIAITGTNGKSTTCALVGEIFRQEVITSKEKGVITPNKVVVAGNIGYPLSQAVKEIDSQTVVVLEVSSYQLELIEKFHPRVGAILNITPDHLERHQSLENYAKIKARIYVNQTKDDFCIFNAEDEYCRKLARDCLSQVIFFSRQKPLKQGIFLDGKNIILRLLAYPFVTLSPVLKIPGPHNLENALSAVAIGIVVGLSPQTIVRGLESFSGLEHRLEFVREIKGIKFINDSKATNPDSVLVALRSFTGKGVNQSQIILIMGGRDKGLPYRSLLPLIKEKVKVLLLIGEAKEKIAREFAGIAKIIDCVTLEKAVEMAYSLASSGEIVLFSPGCASFDQFRNFEERGKIFKDLVWQIKE